MAARLGLVLYWVFAALAALLVLSGFAIAYLILNQKTNGVGDFIIVLAPFILSAAIVWAAGLGIDYILAGPQGKFAQYRYRRQIRKNLDFIFQRVKPKFSKSILVVCFGIRWRSELRLFEERGNPRDVASVIAGMSLERMVATMSVERRQMTLYAFSSGNNSNVEANKFRDILEGVALMSGEGVYFKFAISTLKNALMQQGAIRMNRTLGEIWDDVLASERASA